MKTFERSIGCRNIRREIEEAGQDEDLSPAINAHMKSCGECETFFDQQFKLRAMVASLGTVAAPNDFEFRLRARLAAEKRSTGPSLSISNLSFGLRATAFAAILLLVGSAFLVMRLRPESDSNVVAGVSQPEVKTPTSEQVATNDKGNDDGKTAIDSAVTPEVDPVDSSPVRRRSNGDRTVNPMTVVKRESSRTHASSAAPVVHTRELMASDRPVFPVGAAPQDLKVSVDNGRGTPRTISVPGVSFGSQRVLTQNPTPLMASSRGAW